ncbi:MAG: methyltransferase domain-containing protein, partial [Armatimonadetes bacterium]|nr:methyltransferase domain-containing protein [Armatimonadota bacterium]
MAGDRMGDLREDAARFYDLNPHVPRDMKFYRGLIPSPDARVLELGCGTGRILVPLAAHCGYIRGIDISDSMIAVCRRKLTDHGIPPARAAVEIGDITAFQLDRAFNLIIAPFRVFQVLVDDAQVEGFFRCVRAHLAPRATCVLNVFNPLFGREEMAAKWPRDEETLVWEVPVEGGCVTCHDVRRRLDSLRQVIYPELVYRRYGARGLEEEVVLPLAMRYYYPEQFEALVAGHGFRIVRRWGGYAGEAYGEGPELVLQFG